MTKAYNPETLKQISRENLKLNEKQLKKELAKMMINPCFFNDRASQIGSNKNLDSHHINHAKSKLTIETLLT